MTRLEIKTAQYLGLAFATLFLIMLALNAYAYT